MKKFFTLSFILIALFYINALAQKPSIVINGSHALAADLAKFPYWLNAGTTLDKGNKVISIPVIQFDISYTTSGKSLVFDSVLAINSLQTVPQNKAWKIESVILDTTVTLNTSTGSGTDNWGSQVVITNSTLEGNGTVLTPLGIAQQGAFIGQVLKWNGTAWLPQTDTVYSDNTIAGYGISTSPVSLAQQGATNGQVLQWNGLSWVPGKDTAHTDITLSGIGTISNPLRINQQGANTGQVLTWNGTSWGPQDVGGNPNLDFDLTSNISSTTSAPNFNTNAVPIVISTTYKSGTGSQVALSITGLPAGVTANFSPSGGFPSFNSNLTFDIDGSVSTGSYPIVVTATGGIANKTLNLTLNIMPLLKVFATANHAYKGNLGGLSGADNICQSEANSASLPGTFKAWLSSSSVNAKDRINDGVYVRTDNAVIAFGIADLIDGSIMNNINKDASGNDVGDWPVWTGTDVNGNSVSSKHCNNWTNATTSYDGWIGSRSAKNSTWTDYGGASGWGGCSTGFGAIYCFQQ